MRAFLAVAISADLRERVTAVQSELKALVSDSVSRVRVTWVKPETIHLTMKFLGELDDDAVEPLRARINDAVAGRPAIEIPLGMLGAFPRLEAPRALWIGPSSQWDSQDEATQAQALAGRIDEACGNVAESRDSQPWRPHLTVARVREGHREVGQALRSSKLVTRPQEIGVLRIREISLMKSDMRPDGPVHTPLWAVALHT